MNDTSDGASNGGPFVFLHWIGDKLTANSVSSSVYSATGSLVSALHLAFGRKEGINLFRSEEEEDEVPSKQRPRPRVPFRIRSAKTRTTAATPPQQHTLHMLHGLTKAEEEVK